MSSQAIIHIIYLSFDSNKTKSYQAIVQGLSMNMLLLIYVESINNVNYESRTLSLYRFRKLVLKLQHSLLSFDSCQFSRVTLGLSILSLAFYHPAKIGPRNYRAGLKAPDTNTIFHPTVVAAEKYFY